MNNETKLLLNNLQIAVRSGDEFGITMLVSRFLQLMGKDSTVSLLMEHGMVENVCHLCAVKCNNPECDLIPGVKKSLDRE